MTDKQLEYILTIANEGNITRAAAKLYVSQASLSQVLQYVEKEIGVTIFSRTPLPLKPTYEGELFLRSAKQILEIKQNLMVQYDEVKNCKAGRIHVGMSQDRSWLFTPLILPNYVKEYPKVEIMFTEGNQAELTKMLLQGQIDIIFTIDPFIDSRLSYHMLFKEQMLLILPKTHRFTEWELTQTDLSRLEGTPFILTRKENHLRSVSDQILSDAKLTPRIFLETHSMDVCMRMVSQGLGASIVPDTLYYLHGLREQVWALPMDAKYSRDINLAQRKDMYLPFIMTEFIRIATERLRQARQNCQ